MELHWLKEIPRNGAAENKWSGTLVGEAGLVNNLCAFNTADSPLAMSRFSGLVFPPIHLTCLTSTREGLGDAECFYLQDTCFEFIKMVRSWLPLLSKRKIELNDLGDVHLPFKEDPPGSYAHKHEDEFKRRS